MTNSKKTHSVSDRLCVKMRVYHKTWKVSRNLFIVEKIHFHSYPRYWFWSGVKLLWKQTLWNNYTCRDKEKKNVWRDLGFDKAISGKHREVTDIFARMRKTCWFRILWINHLWKINKLPTTNYKIENFSTSGNAGNNKETITY